MSQKKSDILSDKTKSNVSSPSPVGKKLIQARLPFKSLTTSPKVVTESPASGEPRKRKLSSPTDDCSRSMKLSRTSTTTKENIRDDVPQLDIVDLIDDSDDQQNGDDVVIVDEEKVLNGDPVTPKTSKKSIKFKGSAEKRPNSSDDLVESAKVLIKIPSSKKKKSNERLARVKRAKKIVEEENNEDDDVIPIDSEDNSLVGIDDKDVGSSSTEKTDEKLVPETKNDEKRMLGVAEESEKLENSEEQPSQCQSNQEKVTETSDVPEIDCKTAVSGKATSDSTDVPVDCVANTSNEINVAVAAATSSDGAKAAAADEADAKNSVVSNECSTPTQKAKDTETLTPKQLQRKLESEKRFLAKQKAKEERERKLQEAKEERERKLQEEKELRQKEREEKERQRKKERDDKEEQKRKEREDKEEQRRKEKEEREKKKQAEIDAKNEERRQKEEEKRLKEEEKTAKEEAEIKKKRKEAEAFTRFFAKKNKSTGSDKMDVDETEIKFTFMPFRIKDDMRLAPIVRRKLSPTRKTALENSVLNDASGKCSMEELYIKCLKTSYQPAERQARTWPAEDPDVMIVDDLELEGATAIEETSSIQKYRAKFLKFSENRRPPYYGTWLKKSSVIKARKPFATDSKFFDYEVDSDDEWEDEEPGESLHGSDDEKDKESDDDYDIDNEFFVPHGHLSDEEMALKDEIDEDNSPDTQKAKLKIMQKEFSDEMKQKTEKIKPRLIGLIWQNRDGSQPQGCPNVIWDMLKVRSMILNGQNVVIPKAQSVIETNDVADDANDPKRNAAVKKRVKITDDVVIDLIRLIHGNPNKSAFLIKEFHAFVANKNRHNDNFHEFSSTSIKSKIRELAEWKPCPEEGPLLNKYCWYVAPEHRKRYKMDDLSIVNAWEYILTPKTKSLIAKDNEKAKNPPEVNDEITPSSKTPKSKLGNIAKFAKVLSDDDKKKHFSLPTHEPLVTTSPIVKTPASPAVGKKRVKLLMSGPRGQEMPAETKNSLISQFLSTIKKSTNSDEPICID